MGPARKPSLATLRRGFEVWNEGALDRAAELWHEELVWVESPLFPDSGEHRGRDACVARMRERIETLGPVQIELRDVEWGDGRILLDVKVRGEGSASGVPVERTYYFVWELAEDHRVLRWREFLDRDEAERALRE